MKNKEPATEKRLVAAEVQGGPILSVPFFPYYYASSDWESG